MFLAKILSNFSTEASEASGGGSWTKHSGTEVCVILGEKWKGMGTIKKDGRERQREREIFCQKVVNFRNVLNFPYIEFA